MKSILKNGSSSKPSTSKPTSTFTSTSAIKTGSASVSKNNSAIDLSRNTKRNSKTSAGNGAKARVSIPVLEAGRTSSQVKKGKGSKGDEEDQDEDDEGDEGSEMDVDDEEAGDRDRDEDGADELGTDEEIELAQGGGGGSKKAGQKRKRPTTATEFGSTLTSLLADVPLKAGKKVKPASDQPATGADSVANQPPKSTSALKSKPTAQPILALSRTKLPPSRAQLALERKAEEAVKRAKVEREEKARVVDVMEGWGQGDVGAQEFERGLRKVAQKGVIKLFNAILAASKNTESQSLADQAGVREERKTKERDNVLGRGGKERLTKEGFLDMVRKG